MHSVYPNPPPTPSPTLPSPPTAQPADTHIDLQAGEKSYTRGDVETMGWGGSNIRQQSELSVAGSKNKEVEVGGGWVLVVGQWWQSERRWLQATIPARAQNNAYPVAWWGCAVHSVKSKTNVNTEGGQWRSLSLQKMLFLQLQGGCTQGPPARRGPRSYLTSSAAF